MKKTFILILWAFVLLWLFWCAQKVTTVEETYTVDPSDILVQNQIIQNIATWDLNDEEKQWLIHMREEEKLARDVYTALWNKRWIQIFHNIAASEQTHTNAIKDLLDRYQITDPVTGDIYGEFTSQELQNLYTVLITKGESSLLDALIVWATIEDLDIKDLQWYMQKTDNEDILLTYKNLEKWSRNHLRAYIKQIQKNWGIYTPSYISQEAYDSIIASNQERWMINQ